MVFLIHTELRCTVNHTSVKTQFQHQIPPPQKKTDQPNPFASKNTHKKTNNGTNETITNKNKCKQKYEAIKHYLFSRFIEQPNTDHQTQFYVQLSKKIKDLASRRQQNYHDKYLLCVYSVEILLMMDSGPVRNM